MDNLTSTSWSAQRPGTLKDDKKSPPTNWVGFYSSTFESYSPRSRNSASYSLSASSAWYWTLSTVGVHLGLSASHVETDNHSELAQSLLHISTRWSAPTFEGFEQKFITSYVWLRVQKSMQINDGKQHLKNKSACVSNWNKTKKINWYHRTSANFIQSREKNITKR